MSSSKAPKKGKRGHFSLFLFLLFFFLLNAIRGASEVELDGLTALRKSSVLSVRLDDRYRKNPAEIARLPVGLPDGGSVPLSALADIEHPVRNDGRRVLSIFNFVLPIAAPAGTYRIRVALRSPFSKKPFYRHKNGEPMDIFKVSGRKFEPVIVDAGTMKMTGRRFEPVIVDAGTIKMTGQAGFEPITVRTDEIKVTGVKFDPVTVRTDELSMTGRRFDPVTLRTDELTMTGRRFDPVSFRASEEMTMTGRRFDPMSFRASEEMMMTGQRTDQTTPAASKTGNTDFSKSTVEKEKSVPEFKRPSGLPAKTGLDPAEFSFRTSGNVKASFNGQTLHVHAPGLDAGWKLNFNLPPEEKAAFTVSVGQPFKFKLNLAESPLNIVASGSVMLVAPGTAKVEFSSLMVAFDGEESMDVVELPVAVTAVGSAQVPVGTLKISVSPGEEVEE